MDYNIEGVLKIDKLFNDIKELNAHNETLFDTLEKTQERLCRFNKEVEESAELDELLKKLFQVNKDRIKIQSEISAGNKKLLSIQREMRQIDASVFKRGYLAHTQRNTLGINLEESINLTYSQIDLRNKLTQHLATEIEIFQEFEEKLNGL